MLLNLAELNHKYFVRQFSWNRCLKDATIHCTAGPPYRRERERSRQRRLWVGECRGARYINQNSICGAISTEGVYRGWRGGGLLLFVTVGQVLSQEGVPT
jgi:hypothetical protein